jgi:hypothetical protein
MPKVSCMNSLAREEKEASVMKALKAGGDILELSGIGKVPESKSRLNADARATGGRCFSPTDGGRSMRQVPSRRSGGCEARSR